MDRSLLRQCFQLSAVWTLLAAIPAVRAWLFQIPDFWFHVYILVLGLIVAPLLITWFSFLQSRGKSWVFIVLIQVSIAVALVTLYHVLTYIPPGEMRMRVSDTELNNMAQVNRMTFHALSGTTYSVFTSFIMISAMGLLIVYNEQVRQRSIRESELRESLTRAQIKALQSELQPHFIFNTLHSVSSLMETEITKAQDLIEQFSFLMRHYLAIIHKTYYTVNEEVNFLEMYIGVLQYRYARQIDFKVEIEDGCANKNLPVILLQPVVENCIKHSRGSDALVIEMQCRAEGKMLIFTVKDNGQDKPGDSSSMGVGLRNLQERLSIIYGDTYLYTAEFNDGHKTTISIPAR